MLSPLRSCEIGSRRRVFRIRCRGRCIGPSVLAARGTRGHTAIDSSAGDFEAISPTHEPGQDRSRGESHESSRRPRPSFKDASVNHDRGSSTAARPSIAPGEERGRLAEDFPVVTVAPPSKRYSGSSTQAAAECINDVERCMASSSSRRPNRASVAHRESPSRSIGRGVSNARRIALVLRDVSST